MKQTILRGDIYCADLNPVIGSEQGGRKPVLVIQNDLGNRCSSTVIVVAITAWKKVKLPTHAALNNISEMEKDSIVLLE